MAAAPLIIHTEASPGDGGQEARTFAELKFFRERGCRVLLLAPRDGCLFKRCEAVGIPVHAVSFTKLSQPLDFLRLVFLFLWLRPHAVCTHSSVDSWVALAAGACAGVRRRVRYRHVSVPVKPTAANRFLYRRLATDIVTTGECISLPLHRQLGVPLERLHTIPTGIRPPEPLPARENARTALQLQLKLPPSARFVGMVAVMRMWKGHTFLMEAFASLAGEFPDHHLVLVGGGSSLPYFQLCAAKTSAASRIHFVGQQPNVWPYLRAFDVALLTSTKSEGIPQSLLQAMFCQTPVIGTNVGGIPEIVGHGVTGLLCEGSSASAIAGVLREALGNPAAAAERAATALEMVRANNTVEMMGERIGRLLGLEKEKAG